MKSVDHLSVLFKLSSLLLLSPFYNSKIKKFKVNKLYLYCANLVFFGYFAVTLYYYAISEEYKVADLLYIYVFQGFAIVVLQMRGVSQGSSLNELFTKFDDIAKCLEKGFDARPFRPKLVCLIYSLSNFAWVLWTGCFIWRQFDGTPLTVTRMVVQFLITTYLLNSTMLQFCSIKFLSAYFERFVWTMASLKFEPNTIITAAYLHKSLRDAVVLINSIFGWSMLICTVSNCCFFLKMLQVVLQNSKSIFFVVYLISKALLCTVSIVVVIVECQKYYSNDGRIRSAVQELQLRWQGQACKALSLLAEQTSQPLIKVTAADFFAMDYSLLFTLANLMATYIIVVWQTSS